MLENADLKIILLGDSAVGKSKLVERFLMDKYQPIQLVSFCALTLSLPLPPSLQRPIAAVVTVAWFSLSP